MKKKVAAIVAIFFVLISNINFVYGQNECEIVKAKVVEDKGIEEVTKENGIIQKVQAVEVRILDGEYENEEYEMNYVISENTDNVTFNVKLEEDDNILIFIEEIEGEVTKITYKETINENNILYIILAILIILALIVAKKNAIKPLIVFIATILIILGLLIFAIKQKWNIILVSSVISLGITIVIAIKVNGINKKTGVMIICSILGTIIAGILAYLLFDIIKLTNINIRIVDSFINIKNLFCSATILLGGVLSNIIVLSSLNMFTFLNKPYKTKSDNIIEGQRSLKL